jgi:outer membrane immunogenic protein
MFSGAVMKRLATVIAVAGLIGTPAFAADMAVKAPPPAPAAPILSWTGFFLGAGGGARWSDPDWNTTCLSPGETGGTGCPTNGVSGGTTRLATNNPASFDTTSFRGGVYGGYNYQLAPIWVVGIEGDFGGANNAKTIAGIPGAEDPTRPGSPAGDTAYFKQTWDAGIRARVGYLLTPTALLFISGGGAWTRVTASAQCGGFANSHFPINWCSGADRNVISTTSATMGGWSIGGGLEYIFGPHWLLRGEYRYTDYGHFNFTLFPVYRRSRRTRMPLLPARGYEPVPCC